MARSDDRSADNQPASDLRADFDSLRPGESNTGGATRRTALKAALGVGYAASTLPVSAQTAITTSSEGLKTRIKQESATMADIISKRNIKIE